MGLENFSISGDLAVENKVDLEQRVSMLEKEVSELKRRARNTDPQGGDWPQRLIGRMKQFPEWEGISQIGKELGNAQGDYAD